MVLVTRSTYRAFGRNISSDLDLPELQPSEASRASTDLTISLASLGAPGPQAGEPGLLYPCGPDAYRLDVADVGSYLIRQSGREILVDPLPGAAPEVVRIFLLGSALGTALHLSEGLALHASAVEIDGRAVLFVGDCGAGKSTTAAAFVQRGYRMVADDVAYLTLESGRPLVHQGVKRIKLWQTSVDALDLEGADLTGVHPDYPQRRSLAVADRQTSAVLLGAVVVLTPGPERSVRLERLHGLAALSALVQNTYRPSFVATLGQGAAHMAKVATMAQGLAVYRLHRPDQTMSIDPVVQATITQFRHSPEKRGTR